jgi:spermidine synthase
MGSGASGRALARKATESEWTPRLVAGVPWQVRLCIPLLALSGCAALLYELVWFQQLELVIGSSAVSLGVLLSVFMGGMCAGSLLFPRFVPEHIPPFRAYAALELGIALCAGLVWIELPLVNGLYAAAGGQGAWGLTLRAVVAAACLLPPTLLMGAVLPALSRWTRQAPAGVSWVGVLYASNTLGAVAGCLLAGFYLLRIHDMATATLTAAGINAALGAFALLMPLSSPAPRPGPAPVAPATDAGPRSEVVAVHVVVFLSGLCALGGEVVWTRLLAMLLGATVYTFSIILAVILLGICVGGGLGANLARGSANARRDLGLVQGLLALAVAWAAFQIDRSLPYWPIAPGLSRDPWNNFQLDFIRCLWALAPAATLWGASFPLALAAAGRRHDPARLVASVYAANTLGAIAGALLFTFVVLPVFGSQAAQRLMVLLSLAGLWVALVPSAWPSRRLLPRLGTAAVLALATLAAVPLVRSLPGVPGDVIAFGRSLAFRRGLQDPRTGKRVALPQVLYAGEGLNESVAVSEDSGVRLFHVSGKIEASTSPKDMRLQRLLGLIPAIAHPHPRAVLIVGFGAGVTAGTFVNCPTMSRIVICELEPRIPKHVAPYFSAENFHVVSDPRVQIVYDDARHFLLTTKEHFDIITSDPIHPWVKGSAVLYSKQYFQLVKEHLNPGGVVSQWAPLYQSSEATIKGELATFMTVFPEATVWGNLDKGQGYDLVLMGGATRPRFDLDEVEARLERPEYAALVHSMQAVGFASWQDLLYTYAGRSRDLAPWLAGAVLNEDGSLKLQYQAGMESLVEQEADIYSDMTQFRTFPTDLFVGSEQHVSELREKGEP